MAGWPPGATNTVTASGCGTDSHVRLLWDAPRPQAGSMGGLNRLAEKFLYIFVEELHIRRIGPRPAGKMAPDRGHGDELGIRHVLDLDRAVFHREIEVGLARHHIGQRRDGAEGLAEISLVDLVVADI